MGCIQSNLNEIKVGKSCYIKVVDVYDGQTLVIVFRIGSKFYKRRCKIYGVECEKDEKSKEYVKKLLLGRTVWAAFEREDKNKNLIAYIWLDKNENESIDKIIIRAGIGRKPEYQSNILNFH